ncbi:ABC transporter ATP-binding protein [Streptomyces sp. NPDC005408]|uniref:ABC transporter ATP-binding protein n=1 Tax=Streptomyces sp. NPDC005408 TaxID=3155341 RepID=UPI0033B16B3C
MVFRLLLKQLRPYRTSVILLGFLQLTQVICMLYLPVLNAEIINGGVLEGDSRHILRIGVPMLLVTLIQVGCTVWAMRVGARLATDVGRDLRSAVFDRVQGLATLDVGRFDASSLITRTVNDVQQVQTLAMTACTVAVSAPLMCLGAAVLALGQDVPLSVLLLALIPVLVAVIAWIVRRTRPWSRRLQEGMDTVNRVLREQITGVRIVRAFVKDDYERERFGRANDEMTVVAERMGGLTTLILPTVTTVVNAAAVPVVWIAAQRIDSGEMRFGALTVFLSYLMQILTSVMMLSAMLLMLPRAEICAVRITEVLNTESSVVPPSRLVREVRRPGLLELRGAGFRYPGAEEPVLRDIDLVAEPGSTTAVIGSTASGKTALLALLARLVDATEGRVLVGGEDIRQLTPKRLARAVGLVPQTPYLFSGTVASNLRFGRPDATDDELWHALEVAQARDFVDGTEGGLGSPVAAGGANLSGGQRQRLAIARALVARPEIYLFDAPFSALDHSTESALRTALAEETAGATVVLVSQRVNTIRDAERIVVLDGGRVVSVGTHDNLLAGSGTYREIVSSQLTEEQAV